MARVAIPITSIARTGTTPPSQVDGDATNDHYVVPNGTFFLEVVSSDAGAQTVTIETPGTVDGNAVADLVVSVPAGATRLIGPFPSTGYVQTDGFIYVNPSVSTTLKFRAYRI